MNAVAETNSGSLSLVADESAVGLSLDAEDVVLVSGGAKGITFELALELARQAKTNFALLGSSPPPASEADPATDEVLRNFARLREAGSRCVYVQADVTDLDAVRAAVAEAERQLGAITAIFHGAGVTDLRGIRDKPLEEFQRCIGIKARGLYNLLAAVPPARLKALHVISSVLGNSGMRGQVDYTFANAWLDGAVRSFKAAHPRCHCLSLGYSVWSGTGLGSKIGALESLRAVGVMPIEIEHGVAAYRELLRRPHAGTQFVITGRLTTDLEANLYPRPLAARGRFLEKILRWIPGAEIIAEATLSHATDLYLSEHVFEGTPMFPGVMAIEAMVQVAMACAAREDLPVVRNIAFRRPLIVPEEGVVVVRTLALAEEGDGTAVYIRVAMRSAADDFQQNHFEAECWFGLPEPKSEELPRCPPLSEPLALDPEELSPVPLFQGKFFRRITAVRKREMEKESIADVECPQGEVYYAERWSQGTATPSPAARDAVLQAGAVILPRGCLPVNVGELRVHCAAKGRLHCHILAKKRTADSYVVDGSVFDETGTLVETLRNLVLRVPAADRSFQPSAGEQPLLVEGVVEELRAKLPERPHALAIVRHIDVESAGELPELPCSDRERIERETSTTRRASAMASLVAARRAVVRFAGEYRGSALVPADVDVANRADGKPELHGMNPAAAEMLAGVDVSLADGGGVSIALVGMPPVGIDVEAVACRDCETWRGLLGYDGYALALQLQRAGGESFDRAATRVWTLIEAGKKARALRRLLPKFAGRLGGPWLSFKAEDGGQTCEFISVLLSESEGVIGLCAVLSNDWKPAVGSNSTNGTKAGRSGGLWPVPGASSTMRAFRFHRFGLNELRMEFLPEPRIGPGMILVRTKALSLNYRDLLMLEGRYNPQLRLPAVPLSDCSGVVEAVGDGVVGFSPGDRVASFICPAWIEGPFQLAYHATVLANRGDGVAAEFVMLEAEALSPVPPAWDFAQSATLTVAALTAWSALVTEGNVKVGQTVVVLGTGGVSIFALQFAKAMGARVIVTSSNDAKLERAKRLGADAGINYRQRPDWENAVLELTAGLGADLTIDTGGILTLPKSFIATRAGGVVVVLGSVTGVQGTLDSSVIMMKRLRLAGVFVGSHKEFDAMIRFVEQHNIRPVVDRVFPFAELPDAYHYLRSGQHFGKVVIEI